MVFQKMKMSKTFMRKAVTVKLTSAFLFPHQRSSHEVIIPYPLALSLSFNILCIGFRVRVPSQEWIVESVVVADVRLEDCV
jgi:hypothetical protein